MIRGLSHVAICVPDLEAGRTFYERMFGFELLDTIEWPDGSEISDYVIGLEGSAARGYVMRGANCYLELWHYTAPAPQDNPRTRGANDFGIRHIAFEVDDAVAEFDRLKSLGGIVMNAARRFPDVPEMSDEIAIYCRDPFGNIIELLETGKYFPRLADLGRGSAA
jgi:catechol 2,3-dioxygenase-like lactoylglutathione lyase family enzyme